MRGKKAKAIRRMVYGDQSQRQERSYGRFVKNKRPVGGLRNEPRSLRAVYQRVKARIKGRELAVIYDRVPSTQDIKRAQEV